MAHRAARPVKRARPTHVRRRVLAVVAAALLLATMVYGESWLLDAPATACVECAVTVGVARVLDGESAER
jgi:hypothetical protein